MEPPIRPCIKYGFIRAIWVGGPFSDVRERLHLNNTTKLSRAKPTRDIPFYGLL